MRLCLQRRGTSSHTEAALVVFVLAAQAAHNTQHDTRAERWLHLEMRDIPQQHENPNTAGRGVGVSWVGSILFSAEPPQGVATPHVRMCVHAARCCSCAVLVFSLQEHHHLGRPGGGAGLAPRHNTSNKVRTAAMESDVANVGACHQQPRKQTTSTGPRGSGVDQRTCHTYKKYVF